MKATDPSNIVAYKEGTFMTLKRRVQVDFTNIHVIDDSDALSDCDCDFWFMVDGAGPLHWSGSPSTGDDFDPNAHFTFDGAGTTITLRTTGRDDDKFCGFGIHCTCGLGMPDGNGSNSCADWST